RVPVEGGRDHRGDDERPRPDGPNRDQPRLRAGGGAAEPVLRPGADGPGHDHADDAAAVVAAPRYRDRGTDPPERVPRPRPASGDGTAAFGKPGDGRPWAL